MTTIQFVTSPADFGDYLSKNQLVMAQFTASWCGPCRAITPLIDLLYKEKYPGIEFVRVDLDTQQAVLAKYQISSVPTFIFFNMGEVQLLVSGASIQKIVASLDKLQETTPTHNHGRHGNGRASAMAATAEKWQQVSHLIPRGYEIINSSIDFGRFEALNVIHEDAKSSFKASSDVTSVVTDADSQALLYVPFLNAANVYSVLIHASAFEEDKNVQFPHHIKMWANHVSCLLFESATEDEDCLYQERLDDHEGTWHECRVKFVRFQKCQSITIFIEGREEDFSTSWDKILIIGTCGEATSIKTLQRD